jgi:hypothetical protein
MQWIKFASRRLGYSVRRIVCVCTAASAGAAGGQPSRAQPPRCRHVGRPSSAPRSGHCDRSNDGCRICCHQGASSKLWSTAGCRDRLRPLGSQVERRARRRVPPELPRPGGPPRTGRPLNHDLLRLVSSHPSSSEPAQSPYIAALAQETDLALELLVSEAYLLLRRPVSGR